MTIVMCVIIFSPHVGNHFRFYNHRKKITKIEKYLTKSEAREKGNIRFGKVSSVNFFCVKL